MTKAPDKMLAEWHWIDRWEGSSAAALPMEQRGLYREMLTRSWRLGGSLPADPLAIQREVRCSPPEWRRCWPVISKYWHPDPDDTSRIVNDTQLEVMAEAKRLRDKASEHGKRGARARHAQRAGKSPGDARAGARAQPGQVPEVKPPSPSPNGLTEQQQPRARAADDYLSDSERLAAIVEGNRLIGELVALTGHDPAEVLKRCSMVPSRPGQKSYYLLRLDRARDEHLLRTVNDLRDELIRIKAQRAAEPDLDALDAQADAEAAHG